MRYIVGCDEVGTGACAGSIVVVGVRAQFDWSMPDLNDSKKLSLKTREQLESRLLPLVGEKIISYYLAERSNLIIDKLGLAAALKDAYLEVFTGLSLPGDHIIVDGTLTFDHPSLINYQIESVIKADSKFPTVMAASILAKTYRDRLMKDHHLDYPQYGWDSNVGYPTPQHKETIVKYGASLLHRMSYAPLKKLGS